MKLSQIFFSPNGRMNRRQYWVGIPVILLMVTLPTVLSVLAGPEYATRFHAFNEPFSLLTVVMIYPGLCLYSKRLHDIGLSGWFQVLLYAITLGLAFYVMEALLPGAMRVITEHPHDHAAQQAASRNLVSEGMKTVGYGFQALQILLIAGLGLVPGQARENRYGPAPNAKDAAAVFD